MCQMHLFTEFRRAFDTWHKIQNVAFSKNGSFENESGGLQTTNKHRTIFNYPAQFFIFVAKASESESESE